MKVTRFMLCFFLVNVTALFCIGGIRQVMSSIQDWSAGTSTLVASLLGLGFGLALLGVGSLSIANMPTLLRIWGASDDDFARAKAAIHERAAEHMAAAQHTRGS